MIRKFICSSPAFELDLSNFTITDTAENPWFTGTYFAKYSYPFTAVLTDELDMILGYLSHHNTSGTTLFNGTYVFNEIMEEAVLEVEELEDQLSLTLRYGLDDFPNFSKKLSELPLLQLEVNDIYDHAKEIITQTWPNVAYNFPCLHTDKIDTEQDEYADFMKMINYYIGGQFPRNEFDLINEISHNRNIIQPLPYLLHILKKGFEDTGRELTGEILEDETIQKMLVYSDLKYYSTADQSSTDVVIPSTDYTSIRQTEVGLPEIYINHSETITQQGKFRITGQVMLRPYFGFRYVEWRIKYRNTVLISGRQFFLGNADPKYKDIDAIFETVPDLATNEIVFEYTGGFVDTDIVFNVSINPIRLHDDAGNAIATLINPNEVNLKAAVPDMTFGDLVKLVLNMFNFSLVTTATEARINRINNELAISEIVDLSNYEVRRPKRSFSKGNSYLVGYEDVNSDKYSWAKVFQNANGVSSSGYVKDDKTTELTFNALPLPTLYRNNTVTAHAFLEDSTKPMFVLYNGLIQDRNLTQDATALLIPALHGTYLNQWLTQLIDGVEYEWTFKSYPETLQKLTSKSRAHAYNVLHLVKSIEKTSTLAGHFDYRLTTSVFKL